MRSAAHKLWRSECSDDVDGDSRKQALLTRTACVHCPEGAVSGEKAVVQAVYSKTCACVVLFVHEHREQYYSTTDGKGCFPLHCQPSAFADRKHIKL